MFNKVVLEKKNKTKQKQESQQLSKNQFWSLTDSILCHTIIPLNSNPFIGYIIYLTV